MNETETKRDEAAKAGGKRAWSKPGIRTLRIVGTRTGTDPDHDEDAIMGDGSESQTHRSRYSPS